MSFQVTSIKRQNVASEVFKIRLRWSCRNQNLVNGAELNVPVFLELSQLRPRFGRDCGLTSSAATVRQGQCFLVSLTLTALAPWTVFRALDRFSGVTSRQISLSSEDTPSIWYSSKKLACGTEGSVRTEGTETCRSLQPQDQWIRYRR